MYWLQKGPLNLWISKTREYSVAIFKQICESMLGHIFQRDMSWYYAQAEIFKKFPSLFRRQIETNKIGGSQTKTLINYAAPHWQQVSSFPDFVHFYTNTSTYTETNTNTYLNTIQWGSQTKTVINSTLRQVSH